MSAGGGTPETHRAIPASDRLALAQTHLRRLAATPRRTGTDAVATARAYCGVVLREAGFDVAEQPFEYSELPGRFGTPAAGVASLVVLLAAVRAGLAGAPVAALAWALGGLVVVAAAGWWLGARAVLTLPLLRGRGVNLVATRGAAPPRVWLVAHVDSKSQPVPMLLRAGGITSLALVWLAVIAAAGAGVGSATPWRVLGVLAVVAAAPVIATVVGDRSPGAVDNASGVAAVLIAATSMPNESPVGVVITDAEELGLAGARAWSRRATPAVALNCDGVDDAGGLVAMYSGRAPSRIVDALRRAATAEEEALDARHLIPGVLVDAVALHDAGFETLTLSRGAAATLRRVHTSGDDLAHLRGTGVPGAARVLAHAAVELC